MSIFYYNTLFLIIYHYICDKIKHLIFIVMKKYQFKIKAICREKGLRFEQLAEQLNVSTDSLNASLRNTPSTHRLNEIADILGVTVSELFDDEIKSNSSMAPAVKRIIKEKGISMTQLAEMLLMTPSGLSSLLNRRNPSEFCVKKVAKILNVDTDELTEKEEVPTQEMSLKDFINDVSYRKGISRKELAERLGVTPGGLGSMLSSSRTDSTFNRLAQALGIEVSDIKKHLGMPIETPTEQVEETEQKTARFGFLAKVIEVVKKQGTSLADVANKLNVTEVGLKATLRNGNPQAQTLSKIADCLGVKTYELFPEYEPHHSSPAEGICCPNCGCRLSVKFEGYEE